MPQSEQLLETIQLLERENEALQKQNRENQALLKSLESLLGVEIDDDPFCQRFSLTGHDVRIRSGHGPCRKRGGRSALYRSDAEITRRDQVPHRHVF